MLRPTVDNLRAEIARRQIKMIRISNLLKIHKNYLYILLRGEREMKGDMPYRIAAAINEISGEGIFICPPELGGEESSSILDVGVGGLGAATTSGQ